MVTFVLTTSLCLVIGAYVYRGQAVSLWAAGTFSFAALAAVAWTFGKSRLDAAKQPSEMGIDTT